MNRKQLDELAAAEVEELLSELPGPLRERAEKLPVIFEKCPSEELQLDGIAPDALGLFVGTEYAEDSTGLIPAQILMFVGNLWDFAEHDEAVYREEVRTTFLHELGHFLGLDEDDLSERGLE